MPEYARSLVVILFFAMIVFTLSKKAFESSLKLEEINRFRNIWITTTLLAFFSHDFWVFIILVSLFLIYGCKRERNKPSLFLLLLFVIPPISAYIPGMGLMNAFFELNINRTLSLTLLLPIYMSAQIKQDGFKFGRAFTDKLLIVYIVLCAALQLRTPTFTNTMRYGFYLFTDNILPYYAFSRGLRTLLEMKKAIIALIIASLIAGIIGTFEYLKYWLIYDALPKAMGSGWHFGGYMLRGGDIRATSSLMHPIILGYLMVICLGFYFYISHSIKNKTYRKLGLFGIIGGLFTTMSRGPWVGGVALALTYLATGKKPLFKITTLIFFGGLFIMMLTVIPGGDKFYNLLPYLGKTQAENIDYREQLFTNSLIVIQRYPVFGSINFLEEPEMLELMQGEGIVDVVNTYIGVALMYGLVGLMLFLGIFFSTLIGIYKAIKSLPNKTSEEFLLGRCLISSIIGLMVVIYTASNIGIMPSLYWAIVGMGVAFIRLIKDGQTFANSNKKLPTL